MCWKPCHSETLDLGTTKGVVSLDRGGLGLRGLRLGAGCGRTGRRRNRKSTTSGFERTEQAGWTVWTRAGRVWGDSAWGWTKSQPETQEKRIHMAKGRASLAWHRSALV